MSNVENDRQVKRRPAILRHAEEVTGNVAMTCARPPLADTSSVSAHLEREQGALDGVVALPAVGVDCPLLQA